MVNQVKIGNFKSFGKTQEIPIKPITLIFGANSAGKSSIIQNLVFLEEYFNKNTLDLFKISKNQDVIDLGGVNQFLNQNSQNGTITLGGKVKLRFYTDWKLFKEFLNKKNSLHKYINFDTADNYDTVEVEIETLIDWELEIDIKNFDDRYITKIDISIDQYEVYIYSSDEDHQESTDYLENSILNTDKGYTLLKIEQESQNSPIVKIKEFNGEHPVMSFFRSEIRLRSSSEDLKEYFNKSEIKITEDFRYEEDCEIYVPADDIEDLLYAIFKEIKKNYNSTFFGPWRKIPERLYGNLNQHSLAWKRLFESEQHRSRVNKLLRSLGIQYEVIIEKYHSDLKKQRTHEFISLRDTRNNNLISASDIGTGISQILPILVMLEDKFTGLIYVEQPELHLHPGLQAKWGKALKETSRYKHIIFETHSEHIIKSIQLEVMKANLTNGGDGISNEDVAILYVSRDEIGNSVVRKMDLDETGSFVEPWPDDFFEISADLSFERLKQSYKSRN